MAMDDPAKITFALASVKTGKTVSGLITILKHALQGPHHGQYAWFAPIYATSKMAFDRLVRMMITADPYQKLFTFNLTNMTMMFKHNGATIHFKGAENPNAIYGPAYHFIVVDEASRVRYESFTAILTTAGPYDALIKLLGNLTTTAHWTWQQYLKAKAGHPDYACYSFTCLDAVAHGILSQHVVDNAKSTLPEKIFLRDWMCQPMEAEGAVFQSQHIKQCTRPLSTKKPIAFGIDVAKSTDYTVIIGLDEDNTVCHFQRFQADWDVTEQRILSLPQGPIVIDSTGVGNPIYERLSKKRGNIYPYTFTSKSKGHLITNLQKEIETISIYFPEEVVSELQSYVYKYTNSGSVQFTAELGHDDCVCSLGLALECRNKYSYAIIF